MESLLLAQRAKGDAVDGIALVKTAEVRVASTGSRYLDITLMDATGEMNGKGWDWGDSPAPAAGGVIRMKGLVTEFNNRLQMRVDKLRAAKEEEIDWQQLIPCAPEDPEDMYKALLAIARSLEDAEYAALAEYMLEQAAGRLRIWPAATSYHHAERGGLSYHTLSMARAAEALLSVYTFLDRSLLLCGVLLHDLSKTEEIDATEQGVATGYSVSGMLLGHIVRGVQRVGEAGEALGIDGEKILLVQHMVLAHHDIPEHGSPRRPMFPEAEMLHHLDVMDARMDEMQGALMGVKPGDFSDRVRSLENRRLYNRAKNVDNDSIDDSVDTHHEGEA